jgi:hypothetical protein
VRAWSAAAAATVGATVVLAGCGGSNGGDPSAARPDDTRRLAFATCLRKAGVQVAESAGGSVDIRIPESMSKTRASAIERRCARQTGGGPRHGREASPEEQARFLDQALKFARCMRAHDVAMSDPKPDGHGIRISVNGSSGDPQSPVFRRAQQACGALNPKGKARATSGEGSK